MRLLIYLFFVIILSSCASIKKDINKHNTPKQVYIKVDYGKENEQVFVDSNLNIVINKFNKANENLQINLYNENYSDSPNVVTLKFSDIALASDDAIITGYITSTLGLIAAPLITFNNSNKRFLLAFWYFPRDFVRFSATYRSYSNRRHSNEFMFKANTGALFRNKHRRNISIARAFRGELYSLFSTLGYELNNKTRDYKYNF